MADSTMRYVTGDVLTHIMIVNVRDIARVCGETMKRTGTGLQASPQEMKNLVLCRRLHKRMLAGDYRMTEMEHSRFMDAANWILRQHRLNQREPDRPPIVRQECHTWSASKMPLGIYPGLIEKLIDGSLGI